MVELTMHHGNASSQEVQKKDKGGIMPEEVAKYEFELKVEDVKKYIAPNATDKELFMFMGIAKSYGLNPWKREIHFIKYGTSPGQTVVGYETYIKRAEKTGLLDGWECNTDGKKAFVTIYRKDRSKAFKWEVDFAEFSTGQSTWKKMPGFMLKKVAIAQAFRLCFPEDLGGLPYMPEEITGGTSEQLPTGEPTQGEAQHTDDIPEFEPPKNKSGSTSKKEDFSEIMERERKRLGDERFFGILGSEGFERVEEIMDRAAQIKIYRIMNEAK
jgi:phage recombination protein Bet